MGAGVAAPARKTVGPTGTKPCPNGPTVFCCPPGGVLPPALRVSLAACANRVPEVTARGMARSGHGAVTLRTRFGLAWPGLAPVALAGPGRPSVRDRRVLELVELGGVPEQVDDTIDGASGDVGVPLRTVHQPNKGSVIPDDEGRDSPDGVLALGSVVLLAKRVERPAALDLAEDGIGVDALAFEYRPEGALVAEIAGVVVPQGEQSPVDGQPLLRVAVPHHDPDEHGNEISMACRIVKYRLGALFEMHLVEREGNEGDVVRRTGLEGSDDVLVGVAGKRAPVVPGHGELPD